MLTDATVLDHLARPPERRAGALSAHLALHGALTEAIDGGVARALVAGHAADRLGHAFASGYVEALRSLDPAGRRGVMAFAVTEAGGGHPRAIRTTAEPAPGGAKLRGEKAFVTLAGLAERVFVVANEGTREDGRPRLGVYEVALPDPAARLAALPELPFAPEIGHAALALDGAFVPNEGRLPGDGYRDYVVPFRTIEDLHVVAAALGHRLALSRRFDLGPADLSRGLALAAALLGLGRLDPASAGAHLALDRVLDEARADVAPDDVLEKLPPEERDRLARDLPLLRVAGSARRARRERALAEVFGQQRP